MHKKKTATARKEQKRKLAVAQLSAYVRRVTVAALFFYLFPDFDMSSGIGSVTRDAINTRVDSHRYHRPLGEKKQRRESKCCF